jgi:hypothetical protein
MMARTELQSEMENAPASDEESVADQTPVTRSPIALSAHDADRVPPGSYLEAIDGTRERWAREVIGEASQ